jgi:hypothetical protein
MSGLWVERIAFDHVTVTRVAETGAVTEDVERPGIAGRLRAFGLLVCTGVVDEHSPLVAGPAVL